MFNMSANIKGKPLSALEDDVAVRPKMATSEVIDDVTGITREEGHILFR